jgi:hypothetical protein
MFHRCIAVLLIAVSLFLHAAPTAMAFNQKQDLQVSDLEIGTKPATPPSGDGKWDFSSVNTFFEANPYITKLICLTPGFVSDLLNIALGIFAVLVPLLGILGVAVTDPSNTVTNIQQLMTLTQQLKSMFEQCQNQKTIASILGSNASPVLLARNMAYTLGEGYGPTSFQTSMRLENPWLFGKMSFNSPEGIFNTGLQLLRTAQFFVGVAGEVAGLAGGDNSQIKQLGEDMAAFSAQAQNVITLMNASIALSTNALSTIKGDGSLFTKAEQLTGTLRSIVGLFPKPGDTAEDSQDCDQITDENKKISCLSNAGAYTLALANEAVEGISPEEQPTSGKIKKSKEKFKDKTLSGSGTNQSVMTTPAAVFKVLQVGLVGDRTEGWVSARKCELAKVAYRPEAAQKCALKCAAAAINYISNNSAKMQKLVVGDPKAPCVVGGQTLPAEFCTTLSKMTANADSVRGDIQTLSAIEFYGLANDLSMGEVTTLCAACDGIRALQGTPTKCQ